MGTMYKARAWSFDVLGNPDDGYEVNDRYLISGDLFVDSSILTRGGLREFKKYLHKLYEFRKDIPPSALELEDDGRGVFIFYDGFPCGEIEFLEEVEVSD